ncbi:Type 1 glutamine amidotransferase-like domain-containing protein [Leifsonia sp. NPDC056665]|uniref:Type 1 glutamine amidotransferase-like domain-containing protein n=1 Tax=Leifsonia sp. NPDC056665 TaxID=3345901 RepID=UPI0036865A7D
MTAIAPTILATCGGLVAGDWTDSRYGPLLQHAIELAQVVGRRPRVAHINTAGGDQRHVEGAELEAARLAGVEASHVRFFPHPNTPDLREHILAQDVVWVSGGSLLNLLAVWRAHGLDEILTEAWQRGVVLAGGSAGGLCWHEGGTTASRGPDISALADGLGLVPGSLAVHYDSDPRRRPAHQAAVASGELPGGYALEEGTGLVYQGWTLVDVVSEREGAAVWRVQGTDPGGRGGVTETRIEPRVLPGLTTAGPAQSPNTFTSPSPSTSPIEEARTPR